MPRASWRSDLSPLQALDDPTTVWTLKTIQYAWRSPANKSLRQAWAEAVRAGTGDERAAGPPPQLPDAAT
ncbi:hypothetical protein [Hydrogenophaga sp.]|uniref:hypothetical protein n=1 Tax=Hydrogenophaga sp. TaxID=1904254 RepID=UPI003F6B33AA